ncbi:MAG TPA: Nif3-like dinuclear metal center hexameric protein [Sediminibacterium sp.]|nr:Nif3-like dinuclear metal center hexameric protein [Sediminibacterium sp.]
MQIRDIIHLLESLAHPSLQESYDNAGLLTGQPGWNCTGVLCTLDATEAVIEEAKGKGCNLIVAHHPIIFGGLKRLNGHNYVERAVIAAIKADIAIYAIHTNLDNVLHGVNAMMADQLDLTDRRVLAPKKNTLLKLHTFVPHAQLEAVRQALFDAGAGHIGEYSETSFSMPGTGTFKGSELTNPFAGSPGTRHEEPESRLEVILPEYLRSRVLKALLVAHPYEEVAYDFVPLANADSRTGSGLIGRLPVPMEETAFLEKLLKQFNISQLRHNPLTGKPVLSVAVCGGAGSFLIKQARAACADVFVTADVKYHEFFDAEDSLLLADIGHWESEQFTIEGLAAVIQSKFPTFAVLKSGVRTNPVRYFPG